MKTLRIVSLLLVVVLLGTLGAGCAAGGTKFPEKPVTLVVHASAGGGSDIFARTMSATYEKSKLLTQPIVVENKAGGSGAVAFAYVAGKKGDPYFLLTAVTSFVTTPLQNPGQPNYKDFTPIANLAFDEYFLMVKAESKYKTMKDLIDDAKKQPEKTIKAGGTQLGSADSVCMYLIEKATGVKFNYIVFNSGGEVNAALLGGHVDIAVSNPGEALELAKAGKIRNLGVFQRSGSPALPTFPTMKEQGIDAILRSEPRPRGPRRHPGGCPQGPGRQHEEVHGDPGHSKSTSRITSCLRHGWTAPPSASTWRASTPATPRS